LLGVYSVWVICDVRQRTRFQKLIFLSLKLLILNFLARFFGVFIGVYMPAPCKAIAHTPVAVVHSTFLVSLRILLHR